MAKRKGKTLRLAEQYRDLLLYELMGDNIAKKPAFDIPKTEASFAEKKGFYAELLKHAQIDLKIADNDDGESFFDKLKGQTNAGGKSGDRGDTRRDESGADDDTSADEV